MRHISFLGHMLRQFTYMISLLCHFLFVTVSVHIYIFNLVHLRVFMNSIKCTITLSFGYILNACSLKTLSTASLWLFVSFL